MYLRNKVIKIKIQGFPVKEKLTKTNWHSYISFGISTLLIVSESMPFIDNEYNGILHMLSKIVKEYKINF